MVEYIDQPSICHRYLPRLDPGGTDQWIRVWWSPATKHLSLSGTWGIWNTTKRTLPGTHIRPDRCTLPCSALGFASETPTTALASSGETTPCSMTRVTLHGVVSPESPRDPSHVTSKHQENTSLPLPPPRKQPRGTWMLSLLNPRTNAS